MIYRNLSLALPVAQNLVNPDLLVPACDGKEIFWVGRIGVEREIGNGVFGWASKLNVVLQFAQSVTRRRRRSSKEARHRDGRTLFSFRGLGTVGPTLAVKLSGSARNRHKGLPAGWWG
jgi:hypothetical protein